MKIKIILFLIITFVCDILYAQGIFPTKQPDILITSKKVSESKIIAYTKLKIEALKVINSNPVKDKNIYKISGKKEDTGYNSTQFAIIVEIENKNIFGAKLFIYKKHGFFLGGKLTFYSPEGEKYNWSQDKAENFYKSDFLGYSKDQYYGFNIGYVYNVIYDKLFIYGGVGFLHSARYRQYYDSTFTKWSKDYYIVDGKISKTVLDLIAGAYFNIESFIISIGYSKGSSGIVAGIGFSFY